MSDARHIGRRTLLTGTAAAVAAAVVPVSAARADPPSDTCWTLVPSLSDDFTSFDSGRWQPNLWYSTSGAGAFNPANVTVSGGNLVLTAKKETYNGKSYTFGAVESTFDIPGADSYVEVRAKVLDSHANVLSAIWLQSSPLSEASNPNPEIDIQETIDYTVLDSHLHRWVVSGSGTTNIGDGSNDYATGVSDISADYHLYGLERRNGRLRFYFDGQLAWDIQPPDQATVTMPRHMVLSLEGHLGQPNDSYLPSSFLIDYVHTYQPC